MFCILGNVVNEVADDRPHVDTNSLLMHSNRYGCSGGNGNGRMNLSPRSGELDDQGWLCVGGMWTLP